MSSSCTFDHPCSVNSVQMFTPCDPSTSLLRFTSLLTSSCLYTASHAAQLPQFDRAPRCTPADRSIHDGT
eukprot:587823-Lingulodinium_polyedra.AAC.1